jgi:outer membrane cobalamin receptor
VYENGSVSILGFAGQSQRSNQTYTDIYGKSTNLKNNAAADPLNLNIGMQYKNLKAKVILDAYNTGSKITYDTVENQTIPARFKSLNAEVNYKIMLGTKLNITPKIQYLNQLPWNNVLANATGSLNVLTQKILGNVELDYNYSRQINILAGIESFEQSAQNREITKPNLFTSTNTDFIRNFTSAAYVQGTLKNNIANFTLGGRYLYNNLFGAAFSPRVAVTKAFDDLHFKLLYSEAFKAPTLMNIGLNKYIKPERTHVLEFESGYKINAIFDVSVNVFSILIKDPIVYEPINGVDFFANHNQTGAMGLEGALRLKTNRWNVNLNYAYYNSAGINQVDNYAISQNTNTVLGFANHTANLIAIFNATPNFSISNTLSFVGERYGYQYGSVYNATDSTYAPATLNPTLQWNMFVNKKDVLKGFDVGIGLSNILNQKIYFVQPYDGYNAIYPAFNPMLTLKLAYRFVDFK